MEDPQIFQQLRLDLVETIQSPLIHSADAGSRMVPRFLLFFWCFGTSSPELSIDELRCRFFGVVHGVEGVAAVTGGDGLAGGEFNGSGGVPFSLVLKLT